MRGTPVILAACALIASCGGTSGKHGLAAPADYRITDFVCVESNQSGPGASGNLTNTSSEAQAFEIRVTFRSPSGLLVAEKSASTATLDPGSAEFFHIRSMADEPSPGTSCTRTVVTYASQPAR